MRVPISRLFIGAIFVVFLVVGVLPILAPRPLAVDLHKVVRGPMEVTVSEEGKTRVKELYTVSAAVSGRMERVELDAGDPVVAGKTIAAADLERAEAEVAFAQSELKRNQELVNKGAASSRTLESAELDVRVKRAALAVARNNLGVKNAELAVAKAALIAPSASGEKAAAIEPGGDKSDRPPKADTSLADPPASSILAPINGVLLRKLRESEITVAANEPLFDLGDPTQLEVLVEMRSEDAAKVYPDAPASFGGWGGNQILHGVVRRVEPYGFTKISALGIEEQRVNVILDFTDPPSAWRQLGHGYRVDASIQVWQANNVLKLPIGAMFRKRNQWAVYGVDTEGVVHLQPVEIGHINNLEAEVTAGLNDHSVVILHPSDRIEEGTRVTSLDREGT